MLHGLLQAAVVYGNVAKRTHELACEMRAQATLEYAVVTVAFIAMLCALAMLWRAGAEGVLVELVERAASHVLTGDGLLDIALY